MMKGRGYMLLEFFASPLAGALPPPPSNQPCLLTACNFAIGEVVVAGSITRAKSPVVWLIQLISSHGLQYSAEISIFN